MLASQVVANAHAQPEPDLRLLGNASTVDPNRLNLRSAVDEKGLPRCRAAEVLRYREPISECQLELVRAVRITPKKTVLTGMRPDS